MAQPRSPRQPAPSGGRVAIIQAVQTPIGFFTLVVLVLDGVLSAVAVIKGAPAPVLCTAFGVLVLLILIVALLAFAHPEALRGDRAANIDEVAQQRDQALTDRDQARATADEIRNQAREEVVNLNAALLSLQRERDNVLAFVTGVLNKLVSDRLAARAGRAYFEQFIEAYLRLLLVLFFEDGEHLERFRGACYLLDPVATELTYLHGVWPNTGGYRYLRTALGTHSLALLTVRQNRIKFFPEDREQAFQQRPEVRPYRSFVVVPIPFEAADERPIGALCIDCLDEANPFREPQAIALLAAFANLTFEALRSYGVI